MIYPYQILYKSKLEYQEFQILFDNFHTILNRTIKHRMFKTSPNEFANIIFHFA